MSRLKVVLGTSLTAGLLLSGSGAAFASGTVTSLTATQMVTALNSMAATTGSAAVVGWRASETIDVGSLTGSGVFMLDPAGGVASSQFHIDGLSSLEYAVNRQGIYAYLGTAEQRGAVRMMKRPSARYSFAADKKLRLTDYVTDNGPSPTVVLTQDTNHAGTQTVNSDGSTDYSFKDNEKEDVTLSVDSSGVITRAAISSTDANVVVTFTYGAQHVALPGPASTVSTKDLNRAVTYLHMAGAVNETATEAAGNARAAAHGHRVKVASVRAEARSAASFDNAITGQSMVKVKNIHGGAKVYATNPWTHKTVAYTVKASGREVIVRKA